MEVLGGVSSVFAVLSLAIQLGEKAQKLLEFCHSVKEAPVEILRLRHELDNLGRLLQVIASSEVVHQNTRGISILHGSLQNCAASMTKLETLVFNFETNLDKSGARRIWARMKKPFFETKLEKLLVEVERAKNTIILFQLVQNSHSQSKSFKNVEELNTKISSVHDITIKTMEALNSLPLKEQLMLLKPEPQPKPPHSIPRPCQSQRPSKMLLEKSSSSINLIAGTLSFYTHTKINLKPAPKNDHSGDIYESSIERKYILKVYPRLVLYFWSFEFHFIRAFGQWIPRIRAYNQVDHSPAFKFCMTGEIEKIQAMFREGSASPHDVDRDGWSLLHYAARDHHPDLCRFLIQAGGDANYGNNHLGTPLLLATYRTANLNKTQISAVLDTVRILILEGESDPMNRDDSSRTSLMQWDASIEVIQWILQQDVFCIDKEQQKLFKFIRTAQHLPQDDMLPDYVLNHIEKGLDVNAVVGSTRPYAASKNARTFQGLSLLHHLLLKWVDQSVPESRIIPSIRSLLKAGANIHVHAATGETPLDCILQATIKPNLDLRTVKELEANMETWFQLINDAGHDTHKYIAVEALHHKDRLFNCEAGIICIARFEASAVTNIQRRIWNEYAGPDDIRNGVWVDHISKADNYDVWDNFWGGLKSRRLRYAARAVLSSSHSAMQLDKTQLQLDVVQSNCQLQTHIAATGPELFSQKTLMGARQFWESLFKTLTFCKRFVVEFCIYISIISCFLSWSGIFAAWITVGVVLLTFRFASHYRPQRSE